VVVGGEIASAERVVFPQMVRAARRWSRQRAFDGLQVVASRLQAGAAMGAATMVLQRALGEGVAPGGPPGALRGARGDPAHLSLV
jgi:hypothetical protein